MKVAVITGCTGEIGAASTLTYLEKGYKVYGIGRNEKKSHALFDRCHEQFEFLLADLSNEEGIHQALRMLEKLPAVHVLVNCAGINIIKPLDEISFEDFNSLFAINLKASHFLAKICAIKMTDQIFGRIVNVSSIWGVISKEERSLYSASKSGLNGLTRALAVELANKNILVNAISPGFIDTQLTSASLTIGQKEELIARVPLQRLGETQEIAKLIHFFGSEANTFVTGQNIIADGGFSIV